MVITLLLLLPSVGSVVLVKGWGGAGLLLKFQVAGYIQLVGGELYS